MPVSDPALGEVIGRQFEGYPVASHDLDAVPAKSSGHAGQYRLACVEFHCEHPGPEFFDHFSHYFDSVFFWQMILLKYLANSAWKQAAEFAAARTLLTGLPPTSGYYYVRRRPDFHHHRRPSHDRPSDELRSR